MNLQIENPDVQALVLVSRGAEGILEGLGDLLGVINMLAQCCIGSGGGAKCSGDWCKKAMSRNGTGGTSQNHLPDILMVPIKNECQSEVMGV